MRKRNKYNDKFFSKIVLSSIGVLLASILFLVGYDLGNKECYRFADQYKDCKFELESKIENHQVYINNTTKIIADQFKEIDSLKKQIKKLNWQKYRVVKRKYYYMQKNERGKVVQK